MNAFSNPRNGASLTNIIDVTAHSISLSQENEQPKNINDMFIPKDDISIAEPIDAQIDELGNNTIQMYQFVGIINDKAGGLEPLLDYMNKNCSVKTTQQQTNIIITLRKNNTTKRHITYTIQMLPKHTILN